MSGADGIVVRFATADDDEAIRQLVGTVMGWGGDAGAEAMWRWKHERNAFGRSPVWIADDGGRVAGVRVFLRWQFTTPEGAVLRCVRAVDTVTHPDYRGRGLFRRLTLHALDQLREDGIDFVFNTPNDQSRPGYLSMGWVPVRRLPVTVWGSGPRGWAALIRNRKPADLASVPTDAGAPAEGAIDDDVAAALCHDSGEAVTTHRTVAYLRWRYAGLPSLRYRVFSLGVEPRDAVAVVRLRRRGGALEATVAESFSSSPRAGRTLLRRIVRQTGASYALALPSRSGARGLTVPTGGPLLTARTVTSDPPAPPMWDLSLGDVELF